MKRSFSFAAVLLATSGALALKTVIERSKQRGISAGTAARPEFQGHPLFVAASDPVTSWGEPTVLSRLRPLVAGQAMGDALEIGAGTGASFPYYRKEKKIVAAELDPFMLQRAAKRASQLALDIEFHQAVADALLFPDASLDTLSPPWCSAPWLTRPEPWQRSGAS